MVNSGETLIRLGGDPMLTVSCSALEVSRPVAKVLTTVTVSVPGVAMSDAKIVAVNPSVLLNIVGRVLPLICTTELVEGPGRKFGLPAETAVGLMLEIVGAVCAVAHGCIAISARSKTNAKLLGARRDGLLTEPQATTNIGRQITSKGFGQCTFYK
jgi:hypothetical protein